MNTSIFSNSEFHKKKRRLAVFSGGWSGEYLSEVLAGIIEDAEKENIDVFSFVNFTMTGDNPAVNNAQIDFFKVPEISDFDAAILLANSFNQPEELDYLLNQVRSNHIPTIVVEHQLDDIPSIITDNYSGMYSLSEHLMKDHGVKDILFIGGPENHNECQIRLRSLLDAAAANSVIIPEENTIYANWGKDLIPSIMNNWYEERKCLPQAIICANDIMAMAVCEWVRSMGFDVPSNVYVTGYDCISLAQNFDPPITSVNHEWFSMGKNALNMILSLLKGEEVPMLLSLDTTLVIGGTCGCTDYYRHKRSKHTLGRALTRNIMDPMNVDSHFRHFNSAAREDSNKEDFYYSFSYLFEHAHVIEGKDFSLFLYPDIFTQGRSFDGSLRNNSRLERIVSLKDGKPELPCEITGSHQLIFDKSDSTDKAGYYVFIPLHSSHRTYGCAMLTGPLNAASDNQYYIWCMHMIQALEQVEANITIAQLYKKMELLSVTDPLTEVYNRAGCEQISYPRLLEWGSNKYKCVIMLVDMDRMKLINDKFGHANGDKALKVMVASMKEALPGDFIISRFGGDEFFVAGKLDDDMSADNLVQAIEKTIYEKCIEQKLEFTITASIGYSIFSPSDKIDIEKAIVNADEHMYKCKKIHHESY